MLLDNALTKYDSEYENNLILIQFFFSFFIRNSLMDCSSRLNLVE